MAKYGGPKPIFVGMALALVTAFTGFFFIFFHHNFAYYDDEGMLMITIKRFLDGRILYDDIATIYGPLFYFYEWLPHVVFHAPVSHESVRWISLTFWIVDALLVFVFAYKTTRSLLLATFSHLLAFHALQLIGTEVSHPQELCILLVIGLGMVGCLITETTHLSLAAGAVVGAMAVTKINLGAFGIIALTLTLLFAAKPGRSRSALLWAAVAGALVFPVLLMWGHHEEWWARKFMFITAVSLAAAALVVARETLDRSIELRHLLLAVAGFAAFASLPILFALAHGSTMHAIVDLLIVQPQKQFGLSWYLPTRAPDVAIPLSAMGLIAAHAAARKIIPDTTIAILKLLLAFLVAFLNAFASYDALVAFVTPFLWLALIRPSDPAAKTPGTFARALLVLLTIITILYAYPSAGNQVDFTTVPMIILAAIGVADAMPVVRARFRWVAVFSTSPSPALSGAAALTIAYIVAAGYALQDYRDGEPLNLPGTRHIRIEKKFAPIVRDISAAVASSRCTMLASAPGFFSFNFFTGTPAPRVIDYSTWVLSLPDAKQQATIEELSREPWPCVLYNETTLKFWARGRDVASPPLLRYMLDNFVTTARAGNYELMEPRKRPQQPDR